MLFKKVYSKIRKWTEGAIEISINSSISIERLGTSYGGWIIPKNYLGANSICYLVGAGEDISFDLELANRYGCTVHIFDPTPRAISHFEQVKTALMSGTKMSCATSPTGFYPDYPARLADQLQFHPFGIWDNDSELQFFEPENDANVSHSLVNLQKTDRYIKVPVRSLRSITQELGHNRIDLLKIDTEGAEYRILDSILSEKLTVNVLCIEFDETAANHIDWDYLDRIKTCIIKLQEAGYEVIAKEPDSRNYTLMHRRCFDQIQS